jgi:putative FmdB family regulatory protein
MPTYEYKCANCDHLMEAFQSITAKPLKKCPECGKLKLQRLLGTGAGLIFKGSGFYETDYRSDSYKKGIESEKPKSDSSKTDSKKETKTETKKAESKPTKKTTKTT